jgi:hypothetical protein
VKVDSIVCSCYVIPCVARCKCGLLCCLNRVPPSNAPAYKGCHLHPRLGCLLAALAPSAVAVVAQGPQVWPGGVVCSGFM